MIQIAKIMTTAPMRIVVVIPEGEAAGAREDALEK
jgi:hypothetical protein